MGGGMEEAVHGCVFIVLWLADIHHSSFSSKISTLKGAPLLTSYASLGHSRITTAPPPPAPPTSSETHTPPPFPLSTPAQPSRRRPAGPLTREPCSSKRVQEEEEEEEEEEAEEEEEEEEDWGSCDRRWGGENCTTHVCVHAVCVHADVHVFVYVMYMSCIGILYPVPISIPTVIQEKLGVWLKSGRFKLCTEQNGA